MLSSPAAWSVFALGLCATVCADGGTPPEIDGYGDPMPCEGINRFDPVLRPYVGTSFNTKSSGTVDPFDA